MVLYGIIELASQNYDPLDQWEPSLVGPQQLRVENSGVYMYFCRTCMMVLTSVYLSVSSSLPSTLRIKPVEIWLLVNLAFPFLVIISNIVLEVRVLHSHWSSYQRWTLQNIGARERTEIVPSQNTKMYGKKKKILVKIMEVFVNFGNPLFYIIFSMSYIIYYAA